MLRDPVMGADVRQPPSSHLSDPMSRAMLVRVAPAVASVLALACASSGRPPAQISSVRSPDADFSTYRTFDFTGQGDVQGLTLSRLEQMRTAVERALVEKGYRRGSTNADFLVEAFGAFEGTMDEQEVKQRYPSYFQREQEHTFTRTYTAVTNWEEGTLALHILDGRSRALVWAVTAEGAIETSGNPDLMQDRLDEGARRLLADFPAREPM